MNSTGKFDKAQVGLVTLGHGVTDLYGGFLAPLIPALRESMGFSLTEGVFLVSLMSMVLNFSQVFFGLLSDRLKTGKLVAIAVIGSTLGFSAIGLAPSYHVLMFLVVAGALAVGLFHPVGAALAGIHSGNRHSTGMGIFATGGAVGYALGTMTGTTLVSSWGMAATGYAVLFGVVASAVLYRTVKFAEAGGNGAHMQPVSRRQSRLVLGMVSWIAVVRSFIQISFAAFLPTWLSNKGASLPFIGVVLGSMTLCGALGTLLGGMAGDRFGEKHLLWMGYLLSVPLLWAFMQTEGLLSVLLISAGGFALLSSVSIEVSIAQRAYPRKISLASSMVMGMSWGIGSLLVIPAGALATRIGIYPVLMGIISAALLAAATVPLLMNRLPAPVRVLPQEEAVPYGANPSLL